MTIYENIKAWLDEHIEGEEDKKSSILNIISKADSKRPTNIMLFNGEICGFCPCCGEPVDYDMLCCSDCGQALDWSGAKDEVKKAGK